MTATCPDVTWADASRRFALAAKRSPSSTLRAESVWAGSAGPCRRVLASEAGYGVVCSARRRKDRPENWTSAADTPSQDVPDMRPTARAAISLVERCSERALGAGQPPPGRRVTDVLRRHEDRAFDAAAGRRQQIHRLAFGAVADPLDELLRPRPQFS